MPFQVIQGQVAAVRTGDECVIAVSQQFAPKIYVSDVDGKMLEPSPADPFTATVGGRSFIIYADNPPPVGTVVHVVLTWDNPPATP